MSTSLRAAIAATALLALSSPSFAQSTPAEIADADAVKRAAIEPPAPAAVAVVAPAAATVGVASGARPYDSLVASHASSNGIPAELVHRVIVRESRYRADAMGRGGATGLMQIKLATARSMGYTGSAEGLRDPATNLTYGVRYLAGAYRAAGGHQGRAVGYYASGYRGARLPAQAYAKMRQPTVFTTAASGEPVVVMKREVRRKQR